MELKQSRYGSKNIAMQIHVWKKVTSHRHNTQMDEKLCLVAFKRKFHYDDVIKMKNEVCMNYRSIVPAATMISKSGRKLIIGKRDNLI